MSNLKKLVQNLSPLSEPSEYIISGYIFLNEVCNLWAALHFYLLHSSNKMILVGRETRKKFTWVAYWGKFCWCQTWTWRETRTTEFWIKCVQTCQWANFRFDIMITVGVRRWYVRLGLSFDSGPALAALPGRFQVYNLNMSRSMARPRITVGISLE